MAKKKKADPNELINIIIEEIGLDIDENNHIIDQDTQSPLIFNGKKLKYINDDNQNIKKSEVEFDPINNKKLMSNLLNYNNIKQVEEGIAAPISIYYPINQDTDGRSMFELKDSNNNIYTSRSYYNDNLKLMDIMMKMNGEDLDLSGYDKKIK